MHATSSASKCEYGRASREKLSPGYGTKSAAVLLPSGPTTTAAAATLLPSKTSPILIFCSGGGRADEARKTLQKLGYTGTITNGGMPEDLQEAIPEFLEAAKKKKSGSCVIC